MNTGYLLRDGNDISTLFGRSGPSGTIVPSGSIVPYLGVRDTDGWVLCDGIVRNNNADGKYNVLFSLQIGTGGNNSANYTPPNLQNVFLRGANNSQSVQSTFGVDSVTLTTDNLPTHNHSGTSIENGYYSNNIDLTHHHLLHNMGAHYQRGDGEVSECPDKDGQENNATADLLRTTNTSLQVSINIPSHRHDIVINNTGNSTSFSIVPRHMTVNYLLKL
jgi:microcystin-dependent protein